MNPRKETITILEDDGFVLKRHGSNHDEIGRASSMKQRSRKRRTRASGRARNDPPQNPIK